MENETNTFEPLREAATLLARCQEVEAAFYFALLAGWSKAKGRMPETAEELAEALGV